MRQVVVRTLTRFGCVAFLALWVATPALAVHESTNSLVFAPGPDGSGTETGTGTIDYRGGDDTESRWTATFRFEGLTPGESYVVAVQGRFGEDGSPEASEFTRVCTFTVDASGSGGCWYYFVVLIRLSVVQVQVDALGGAVVLQATRAVEGPGSIASQPNRFSPLEPVASPAATPDATPGATPATT